MNKKNLKSFQVCFLYLLVFILNCSILKADSLLDELNNMGNVPSAPAPGYVKVMDELDKKEKKHRAAVGSRAGIKSIQNTMFCLLSEKCKEVECNNGEKSTFSFGKGVWRMGFSTYDTAYEVAQDFCSEY